MSEYELQEYRVPVEFRHLADFGWMRNSYLQPMPYLPEGIGTEFRPGLEKALRRVEHLGPQLACTVFNKSIYILTRWPAVIPGRLMIHPEDRRPKLDNQLCAASDCTGWEVHVTSHVPHVIWVREGGAIDIVLGPEWWNYHNVKHLEPDKEVEHELSVEGSKRARPSQAEDPAVGK